MAVMLLLAVLRRTAQYLVISPVVMRRCSPRSTARAAVLKMPPPPRARLAPALCPPMFAGPAALSPLLFSLGACSASEASSAVPAELQGSQASQVRQVGAPLQRARASGVVTASIVVDELDSA